MPRNLSLVHRRMLVASVLVLLMAWLSVRTLTFFSTDTGVRFLQIQSLIDHRWQSFAVEYPVLDIDPELAHMPHHYIRYRVDEQIFLKVSPFFPLLVSFFYATLGKFGLAIVPALSGIMCAWLVYRLAKLTDLARPELGFWATLFASPIWVYSLELWDHILAAMLLMAGFYGVAWGWRQAGWRRWGGIFGGGIAWGILPNQRPETYLLVAAVGLSFLLITRLAWREGLALLAGGVMGAAPLWVLQGRWFGHFLGPVIAPALFPSAGYEAPATWQEFPPVLKAGRLLIYVQAGDWLTFGATLLLLLGFLGLFLSLRVPRWQKTELLLASLTACLGGYLIFLGLAWHTVLSGWLTVFPLGVLALVYVTWPRDTPAVRRKVYHLAWGGCLLFVAAMMLIWPTFGSHQWGARYLLPLYPLLVYLALANYTHYSARLSGRFKMWFRRGAVGLLCLSLVFQIGGVKLLYEAHFRQLETLQAVQALPVNFILTNDLWFASALTALEDKTILYVADEAQRQTLQAKLARRGETQVAIASFEMVVLDEMDGQVVFETVGQPIYVQPLAPPEPESSP